MDELTKEEEKEFHDFFYSQREEGFSGYYWIARKSYLAGRRSQPVVELPMPDRNDHHDVAFYIQKLRESLAAAGTQYRMKGE